MDSPVGGNESIEQQVRNRSQSEIESTVRLKADSKRGAVLFHKSPAGCVKCHASGSGSSAPGPDLAKIGTETTLAHIVDSILNPSKSIRKGYETVAISLSDGRILTGLLAKQNDRQIVIRDASNLLQETVLDRADVEEIATLTTSMMPGGLVSSLREERDFYDIVRYIQEISTGGPERAQQLQPSPQELLIVDDTADLDHSQILKSMTTSDFEAGLRIFQGHCVNCHGSDGNTPTLATARAFGTQKLRFGADPYRMFLTVSRGAGLMAPLSHLSPRERYQVIHYVREAIMKDRNSDYVTIDDAYLSRLPKGTSLGGREESGDRDFGPVLASQLGTQVQNAITFRLKNRVAVCYDLHRMRLAAAWKGFLDLSETHHYRQRGEGMPRIRGEELSGLNQWQWEFDGSFDLTDAKPARGPIREDWLQYRGHYLHNDRAILSYSIHGREVLESIDSVMSGSHVALIHTLRIGPGNRTLRVSAAQLKSTGGPAGTVDLAKKQILPTKTSSVSAAGSPFAVTGTGLEGGLNESARDVGSSVPDKDTPLEEKHHSRQGLISVVQAIDDVEGLTWSHDDSGRLILTIPPGDRPRQFRVVRSTLRASDELTVFESVISQAVRLEQTDMGTQLSGGDLRWPQRLEVTGSSGEPVNGYALDTIPVPFENPWYAWVRTSALDFFEDGRCVVTTYGGDVYIVSGIDRELSKVSWKRFAAGLFEPFGVRVINGMIYVTCRDGLKRLKDLNGDGEADFIEVFWNDDDVSCSFHAFNFDLQTDSAGNIYFAKAGQYTDHHRPGTIMRVPPEGHRADVVAWGVRTPNGMGKLADDRFTVSDNQGPWMPAGKISLIRPSSFLGNMPINQDQTAWLKERHGGELPKSFDEPIVWTPQELDNSCGGQIWAGDERFGPLSGRLIHSSYGKGWLYTMSLQEVGSVMQGSIIPLPHQWDAGVMRMRFNPTDGQLYGAGLSGWQGPLGGRDGCLQRLRWTGDDVQIIDRVTIVPDGIELSLTFAVDSTSACDPSSYSAEMWDYHWSERYGSDQFSVKNPGSKGHDRLTIQEVQKIDHRTVRLIIPELAVCDQLELRMLIQDASLRPFAEKIHMTVHVIPGR